MKIAICYITCKDELEARKVAGKLIADQLIACATIYPVKSMYMWKGKLVDGEEHVIFSKTRRANYNKIQKAVTAIHSYETPCILMLDADANASFGKWVNAETT